MAHDICSYFIKIKHLDASAEEEFERWEKLILSWSVNADTHTILRDFNAFGNILRQMNGDIVADAWTIIRPFLAIFNRLDAVSEKEFVNLSSILFVIFETSGSLGSLKENILFGLEFAHSQSRIVLSSDLENDECFIAFLKYIAAIKFVYQAFRHTKNGRRKRQMEQTIRILSEAFEVFQSLVADMDAPEDSHRAFVSMALAEVLIQVYGILITTVSFSDEAAMRWSKRIVDDILPFTSEHLTSLFLDNCQNNGFTMQEYFSMDVSLQEKLSRDLWTVYLSSAFNREKISVSFVEKILFELIECEESSPYSARTLLALKQLFELVSPPDISNHIRQTRSLDPVKMLFLKTFQVVQATTLTMSPEILDAAVFVCRNLLRLLPIRDQLSGLAKAAINSNAPLEPGPTAMILVFVRDCLRDLTQGYRDSVDEDSLKVFLDFAKSPLYMSGEKSVLEHMDVLLERHSGVMQGINLVLLITSRRPIHLSEQMRHYLSSQIEKLKLLLTERQSQLMSHRTTLLSDYTTDTANLATNSIVAVDTMAIEWKMEIMLSIIASALDALST